MNNLAGVILAAGKGSRMNSKTSNKVTLEIGGRPMILHGLDLLEKLEISPIIIVVGFAKDSVKKLITKNVVFVEQKKRLGTAHALKSAIAKIPENITDVLVIQGDDSAFYKDEGVRKLIGTHMEHKNSLTFLTVEVSNAYGLGRIIRGSGGEVLRIIEEKDAAPDERRIKEINPACYIFNMNFLRKYLPKVGKSPVTGEYYLVSLVEIAIKNNEKIESVKGGFTPWRGVNTKEELDEAKNLFQELNSGK